MEDREAQVRRLFDVMHARDPEALGSMYTADAEYLRADGTSKGREAIVSYLGALMAAFPDHASQLDAIVVAGDIVTVEWTETATHTQPYEGGMLGTIEPTGKSFAAKIVEVLRFDGDQIASQHEYYDLLSLLGQLGWLDKFVALFSGAA